MKKLMKQIEKSLDVNLSKNEKKELLNYYEEIINDRLENGESLESIKKSFTKDNLRNDPTLNKKTKKGFSWWYLLLMPFVFILGIIIFSLLIAAISVIFAISISLVVLVLACFIYIIEVIITNPGLPLILFVSGLGIFLASGILLLFKPFYKLMKLCFDYLKLGFNGIFNKVKAFLGGL